MYICEAMGMEDFVKEFNTEKQAQKELKKFVKNFTEDNGINEEFADEYYVTDDEFVYGASSAEKFQACFVYKKPRSRKGEMLIELARAEYGLQQYCFELMDTGTCSGHLWKLREMIEKNM